MGSREQVEKILESVDVKINGSRAWDLKVHNDKFFSRVLGGGSLALGESYMDEWWDCDRLDGFFSRFLDGKLDEKIRSNKILILNILKAKLFNMQNKRRAYEVGKKHYDVGNKMYKRMLDKRMVYSCGYWKNAKTLDKAQKNKLELICKKVGLKKGMKVLDIGCGWGSFAKFASEKYGVKVVGVTISKEQAKLAKEICNGLNVDIRLQDYRSLNEKFDRIISIGMFEHVGVKNYKEYMRVVERCLNDDGLFLLHTIGGNKSVESTDPWISKYIFPNSMLPSIRQIAEASEGLFVMEDWHSFGNNYDKTLMRWHKNFNNFWDEIKKDYDLRFKRMWDYYLLACAGGFRCGKLRLWQIVFSKNGVKNGYKS